MCVGVFVWFGVFYMFFLIQVPSMWRPHWAERLSASSGPEQSLRDQGHGWGHVACGSEYLDPCARARGISSPQSAERATGAYYYYMFIKAGGQHERQQYYYYYMPFFGDYFIID
jgi:hypothetical protein